VLDSGRIAAHVFFLVAPICLGMIMVAMAHSQAVAPPAEPVKPSTDVNDYRRIRLENGMEILLVHDANTDKAAASVDVSLSVPIRSEQSWFRTQLQASALAQAIGDALHHGMHGSGRMRLSP
jgi:hypothetical protein